MIEQMQAFTMLQRTFNLHFNKSKHSKDTKVNLQQKGQEKPNTTQLEKKSDKTEKKGKVLKLNKYFEKWCKQPAKAQYWQSFTQSLSELKLKNDQ